MNLERGSILFNRTIDQCRSIGRRGGERQNRFDLCPVEFVMPNEFAGQHGDQVPVVVDKIAGPRP